MARPASPYPRIHNILPVKDANWVTRAFLQKTMPPREYANKLRAMTGRGSGEFLFKRSPGIHRVQKHLTVEHLSVGIDALEKLNRALKKHNLPALKSNPHASLLDVILFIRLNNAGAFGERLPFRAYLERKHFKHLALKYSEPDLLRIGKIGPKSVAAIKAALASLGLKLRK